MHNTKKFIYNNTQFEFVIYNPEDYICKFHLKGQFYEAGELSFIKETIKKDAIIYDIGTMIGNHSVFFDKVLEAKEVVIFEPNTDTIKILEENLRLNNCVNINKSFLGIGIGNNTEQRSFRVVKPNNIGYTMLDLNKNGNVKVEKLDNILLNKHVDFIKIDVEFMEMEVLQGATGIINKYKPNILIEVININEAKFRNFLDKIGYNIKKIFPYGSCKNFFITPKVS